MSGLVLVVVAGLSSRPRASGGPGAGSREAGEDPTMSGLWRFVEIAAVAGLTLRHRVAGVPVGAVMSRLLDARAALVHALAELEGTQR